MSVNFAKLSPFQVDPEKIEALNLTADDFDVASSEEKESVVYKHKSVSYWRDAARRFRANTVSMVALFVFILCLLFAFLGPKLIPYNYSDQYPQTGYPKRTAKQPGLEYISVKQLFHRKENDENKSM